MIHMIVIAISSVVDVIQVYRDVIICICIRICQPTKLSVSVSVLG